MAILFYRKKDSHKAAEKLVGAKIVKSDSMSNRKIIENANFFGSSNPIFGELRSADAQEREYGENPVLAGVINLKADYASNANVFVRNIKNGEIITDEDFKKGTVRDRIAQKMLRLKNNPNPLQSTREFITMWSIFKDVFGNSFTYANSASSKITIDDVFYLWHVWPQFMVPKLTGKIFDSTQLSDIIKAWEWKKGTYEKKFSIDEILHRKEPNVRLDSNNDIVLGVSRQVSLSWALSNIKIAYESRNVIARERGMRAIISSDQQDGVAGTMPMDETEKREVEQELKVRYGFREDQSQYMVTRHNINVHQVDQDVRKLGLLNEIASDGMVVAERYGVPEVLMKLYLKGATFENQESSERRMYQNTTIPEETDRWEDLTNFLRCRDFGYEYGVSFSHIPVLQENEKDKAATNQITNTIYKELFFAGAVTYNDWLQALALKPTTGSWGNKRIIEMTVEEIQIIKGNYTINNSLDNPNQ